MIFLVGGQRSGTNWLQSLLELHPEIAAVPSETALFASGIPGIESGLQHELISSTRTASAYMARSRFIAASRAFCDAMFSGIHEKINPTASHLIERTPTHAKHLSLIKEIYPDAAVLHIIRDGREVALSLTSQRWWPGTIEDAAKEWVECVTTARAATPPHYYEIRHEHLGSAPARELEKVLAWLGLEMNDELRAQVQTHASRAVNSSRTDSEVARLTRLETADPQRLEAIQEIAGELLVELGYPLVPTRPNRRAVVRSIGRELKRATSRNRGSPAAPVHTPWWSIQKMAEQLLAGVRTSEPDAIRALLESDCQIVINRRISGPDDGSVLLSKLRWGLGLDQLADRATGNDSSLDIEIEFALGSTNRRREEWTLNRDQGAGRFSRVQVEVHSDGSAG